MTRRVIRSLAGVGPSLTVEATPLRVWLEATDTATRLTLAEVDALILALQAARAEVEQSRRAVGLIRPTPLDHAEAIIEDAERTVAANVDAVKAYSAGLRAKATAAEVGLIRPADAVYVEYSDDAAPNAGSAS